MAITGTNLDPATVLEWNDTNYQLIRRIETVDPVLGGDSTKADPVNIGEELLNSPINFALATLAARTKWLKAEVKRVTYQVATQAEAEAGTNETKVMTPQRVAQSQAKMPGAHGTPTEGQTLIWDATNNRLKWGSPGTGVPGVVPLFDFEFTVQRYQGSLDKNDMTVLNGKYAVLTEVINNVSAIYLYTEGGEYSNTTFNLHTNNRYPQAITGLSGKLAVADRDNSGTDYVYIYSATGTYETRWALHSTNVRPEGITYYNGKYYVADETLKKVFAYSSTGTYDSASDWNLHSANTHPSSMTVWRNEVYVLQGQTDNFNPNNNNPNKVFVYSLTGTYKRTLTQAQLHMNSKYLKSSPIKYAWGRGIEFLGSKIGVLWSEHTQAYQITVLGFPLFAG